jgi:hypothetical protein
MFDDVISGEKAPLGRILRNSLPVAMPVMRIYTFCTTTIVRKKCGNRCACDHFRDWRDFRFRDFRWHHFRSGPIPVTSFPVAPLFAPPEMWLEPSCIIYYLRAYVKNHNIIAYKLKTFFSSELFYYFQWIFIFKENICICIISNFDIHCQNNKCKTS